MINSNCHLGKVTSVQRFRNTGVISLEYNSPMQVIETWCIINYYYDKWVIQTLMHKIICNNFYY